MQEKTLTITDGRLVNDIKSYCELNDIEDIDKFATKLLKSAFMTEKYGFKPCQGKFETKDILFEGLKDDKTEEVQVMVTKDDVVTIPISTKEPENETANEKKPKKRKLK